MRKWFLVRDLLLGVLRALVSYEFYPYATTFSPQRSRIGPKYTLISSVGEQALVSAPTDPTRHE